MSFKLDLDARGKTDQPFSISTLDAFRGDATLTGDIRALGVQLGYFQLRADANQGQGTLNLSGYAGLGPWHFGTFGGSGTFGPGGYSMRGTAQVLLPAGRLRARELVAVERRGFQASGH